MRKKTVSKGPRKSLDEHLATVPARIRQTMLADPDRLPPGAAASMGRLFEIMKSRNEPQDAPSAESFRLACKSESTLSTLLRALTTCAPSVSTAAGRAVRKEWYSVRSTSAARSTESQHKIVDVASWPLSWQNYYPSLVAAKMKVSSRERYVRSISRCADVVRTGAAGEELTFYTAYCLTEAFKNTSLGSVRNSEIRPTTIANYLEGLIALGRCAGVDRSSLDGIRYMRSSLKDQARSKDKVKFGRIAAIMEMGGFEYIAEQIGVMRDEVADLPDHASRKALLLQTIALCALHMNKPARTGDVSRWVIGKDLIRGPDGCWCLNWEQQKTGHRTEAGALWPEVCEALDALVLGGRPSRMIHLRYRELKGTNWLTFSVETRPSKWPSERIKAAIGIPSHDLRTLAADYMRRYDPETAAGVISAHLGHGTAAAGKEYTALCEGDAAARSWMEMRHRIAP
jgi:hypothetical protein